MTQHTDPIDSQIQRIDAALTRNAERLADYDTAAAQARPAMTFADARATATTPTDARALEAERDDLRIQLGRANAETRTQDRALRETLADLQRAHAELAHVGKVLTDWRGTFTDEPHLLQEADRVLVDLIDGGLLPTADRPMPPVATPPLGSGPARAQGSPDQVAQATRWIDAAAIPVIDRDVRAWLDRLGVPVPAGIWPLMTEIRRAVIAAGDAGYAAGRAQDGRAQGSLTRCCAHPGCPRTYQADVGPQDRGWVRLRGLTVLCPDHAGPETLTEPTPAEVAEHGPTVARVLGDVRAGRPANPDRVHP